MVPVRPDPSAPGSGAPDQPGPAAAGACTPLLARLAAVPDVAWSVAVRETSDDGPGWAGESRDGLLAGLHPDTLLRTASVGKIFLLVEVARQVAAGRLDPAERLAWTDDEHVADSGLWYRMAQRDLSVHDLCVLVGAVSDNLATNVLLRRVGVAAVRRTSESLGCTRSALLDRVRLERGPDDPPTLSVGTAAELSSVLVQLHRGEVVGPDVARQVLGWLAAGTDLSMVAAAFDLDPLAHTEADRGLTLVDKTGTIATARADVGLVTGPRGTLAYAVLANWPATLDRRDAVLASMRAVGVELRRLCGGGGTGG